ncbi:hypothetical protein SEPCBS57363_002982 [Sporothrix epigloea]|uniref:Uncharacterized protein n=1 Tax=Sporothrix epigloea TaxID=1892477 RepID=A0ABP0DN54_9PEZI
MAFLQPTRPTLPRPLREQSEERDDLQISAGLPATLEESQTWVLFSPAADTATTYSALDSLPEISHHTTGRSRLSSLAPSNYASSFALSALRRPSLSGLSHIPSAAESDDGQPDVDEDVELDSLDSHLPDFRPIQNQTQAYQIHPYTPVTATTSVNLPAHDGLGSFWAGNTVGMSPAVQEHLYSFEQFNPRRVTKRRRESLDLAQLRVADEFTEAAERTRRIEAWRLEHSRVLLEEIQKETRRRRDSELSARQSRPGAIHATAAPEMIAADYTTRFDTSSDWHEQEEECHAAKIRKATYEDREGGAEPDEGFWSRITRRFMLEVMGIDDRILSVLFGENLVDEEENAVAGLSSKPRVPISLFNAAAAGINADTELAHTDERSWQLRMLERIARELGIFVHSHINAHPGAFSTFTRVQNMPLPYAGLPVIPESTTPIDHNTSLVSEHAADSLQSRERVTDGVSLTDTTVSLPCFKPTIRDAPPMANSGQATEPLTAAGPNKSTAPCTAARPAFSGATSTVPTFTQEEWEQDLDIKLVFRYLRSRLFSDYGSASSHANRHHMHHHAHQVNSNSKTLINTANLPDAAAKVARVRQHHPLVGRGSSAARQPVGERRPILVLRNMNLPGVAPPLSPMLGLRHGHGTATSCASHSTRRSARRSSISSRHSSRHYWDIGGSAGTGSMIASAGPMGSWGDA